MDKPCLCTLCGRSFHLKEELIHHVLLEHCDSDDISSSHCSDGNAEKPNANVHVMVKKEPLENQNGVTRPMNDNCQKKNEFCSMKTDQNYSGLVLKLPTRRQLTSQLLSFKLPTTDSQGASISKGFRESPIVAKERESGFKKWHDMRYSLARNPDSRALVCGMCNETFRNKAQLHIHIFTHGDNDWFKCNKCGKAFSGKYYLLKHKRSCDSKFFTGIMTRQRHDSTEGKDTAVISEVDKIDMQNINAYVCNKCEDTYVTLSELTEHKKTHAVEKCCDHKTFKCDKCEAAFGQKENCASHEKTCSETPPSQNADKLGPLVNKTSSQNVSNSYLCDVCNKRLETKDELSSHKEIHTYNCKMCGEICVGESKLSDHVQTHIAGQLFHCSVCGIVFGEEIQMQEHECVEGKENTEMAIVNEKGRNETQARPSNDLKIRRLGCMICGKLFLTRQQLKNHVRIHTGERPFQCEFCGRGFTHESNCRRHKRVHTGERPYGCEFCGKAFLQATTLKYHRMVHTKENPFKCELCDRAFKRKCVLRKHKLRHLKPTFNPDSVLKKVSAHNFVRQEPKQQKPRPHKCDVCGKGFPRKPELTRHYRTHTGEKPFRCHICGNAYVEKYTLTKHLKRHREGKVNQGKTCGKNVPMGDISKQFVFSHVVKSSRPTEDTQETHIANSTRHENTHINKFDQNENSQISGKSCQPKGSVAVKSEVHEKLPVQCLTPSYRCDKCRRIYATLELLNDHKKMHECEYCGKQFRNGSTKNKHIRIHIGKKDHQCIVCDKSFFASAALRRHMTVHTDERRYLCNICGFAFKERVHLQRHEIIHTRRGEKNL